MIYQKPSYSKKKLLLAQNGTVYSLAYSFKLLKEFPEKINKILFCANNYLTKEHIIGLGDYLFFNNYGETELTPVVRYLNNITQYTKKLIILDTYFINLFKKMYYQSNNRDYFREEFSKFLSSIINQNIAEVYKDIINLETIVIANTRFPFDFSYQFILDNLDACYYQISHNMSINLICRVFTPSQIFEIVNLKLKNTGWACNAIHNLISKKLLSKDDIKNIPFGIYTKTYTNWWNTSYYLERDLALLVCKYELTIEQLDESKLTEKISPFILIKYVVLDKERLLEIIPEVFKTQEGACFSKDPVALLKVINKETLASVIDPGLMLLLLLS